MSVSIRIPHPGSPGPGTAGGWRTGRRLLRAAAGLASMVGAVAAFAGAGDLTPTVSALGVANVTYSVAGSVSPKRDPLDTYVAFEVKLQNSGGNTVNRISFTFTAKVTDSAEVAGLYKPEVYLPAFCSGVEGAPSFSCNVGQLGAGQAIDTFLVFFKVPVKVVGNGVGDADGSDTISPVVTVQYAEGTNDANSVPQNSISTVEFNNLVLLGTSNPVDVRSLVPKNGARLFTGDSGIPTPSNKLTSLVTVPALPGVSPYTTAQLAISKDLATDTSKSCGNSGHFLECPIYAVTIPGQFTPYLTTVYRIDASNLRLTPGKILNSVLISYTGGVYSNAPVLACVNALPNTGALEGLPCVLGSQCYKRSTPGWTPELDGDCEWTLINKSNGLTRFE